MSNQAGIYRSRLGGEPYQFGGGRVVGGCAGSHVHRLGTRISDRAYRGRFVVYRKPDRKSVDTRQKSAGQTARRVKIIGLIGYARSSTSRASKEAERFAHE
jgi:hypothetical protein